MSEERAVIAAGREGLAAWEAARPGNFFEADTNIARVLEMHLGAAYPAHLERLQQTGAAAATVMDRLARETNRDENLPLLRRHDGIGRRTEEVIHPVAYHQLGAACWRTGVLAVLGEPGNELLSGALLYLLAHNGEAGHACPVACTAGLIKLLQREGTADQQERYLPGLLEPDYAHRLHAAQFVTEVQGGSDVGENGCGAQEDPPGSGRYRISGEKWFCSVADAALFVVTARLEEAPAGTRGLSLFLVPRLVDGQLNHFSIRRLKYKLGTRSMASGEIDFEGARAELLGPARRGFRNLVSVVLDTSRVFNAVVASGVMRRALVEAQAFARCRQAFGRPIIEHPMVQATLARMKMETLAAVATTFRILAMTDGLISGEGGPDLEPARRTQVNINKYWTALCCTGVVRDGIEVLGGNGTIEEFSVLPRLYRDAMVLESWEGTHNTLCAQVLRDFSRRELHRPWLAELEEALTRIQHPSLADHRQRLAALLEEVRQRIQRLLDCGDEAFASLHIRQVVDQMCVLNSYLSLTLELNWELDRSGAATPPPDKAAVVELYRRVRVDRVDPMTLPDHPQLLAQVARC